MLSLVATVFFILLVGSLLASGQSTSVSNPWCAASYSAPQTAVCNSTDHGAATLEHALATPTPLHGFTALPLLSSELRNYTRSAGLPSIKGFADWEAANNALPPLMASSPLPAGEQGAEKAISADQEAASEVLPPLIWYNDDPDYDPNLP